MRSACRALAAATLAAVASAAATSAAAPGAAGADFVFGPYKDVSIGLDARDPRIVMPAWDRAPTRRTLVWAFATGECGGERWAPDVDTAAFAARNVADHVRRGVDYIVSTGGAVGIFTCGSDDGMRRFVARYDSARLVGFDFDIEGEQTDAQIASLMQRLRVLQRERPRLRISFTIATHAAGDGSRRSLNATGERVLREIDNAGLENAVLNLMVMNYGKPDASVCVVARRGGCDMARSALQAARNVHERYGIPYRRIALTAMLGENDVEANVFTAADARRLVRASRRMQLAGVHWWSLDRDQPCPAGEPRVSPRCHALPGLAGGRFGSVLRGAVETR